MLIKRNTNNDVIEAMYESSNIVASKYDKNNNALFITFKTGAEYLYENVPAKDYHMFELAESQGKIFNKYIKPYYKMSKHGDVDIVQLKERMEQAKQEEINGMMREVALTAKNVHDFYNTNNVVDIEQVRVLRNLVNSYLEKIEVDA
jgi:hypothetical protein